jgi:hypothetical protein
MQFRMYHTSYDFAKIVADVAGQKMSAVDKFYDFAIDSAWRRWQSQQSLHSFLSPNNWNVRAAEINQLIAELSWYENGKPYYNLHPRMIDVFGRAKLDFPSKYIEFPFQTVAVNFDIDDNTFKIDDQHRLQSCLVFRGKVRNPLKPIPEHEPNCIMIYMDWNERHKSEIYSERKRRTFTLGEPIMTWRKWTWDADETVDETLNRLPMDLSYTKGVRIPDAMIEKAIKMVVSIAFLHKDESPIVVPHLLKRDAKELRLRETPDDVIQKMHDRAAKERGARGWVVGSDAMFDHGHIGPAPEQEEHKVTGKELQFAHIVSGYWKLCRYGPKMEFGRVRWIMPHVRGWGKPFKHEG